MLGRSRTPADVEQKWALVNLGQTISTLGPHLAFKVVREYIFKALDDDYAENIEHALYEEGSANGTFPRHPWGQPAPDEAARHEIKAKVERLVDQRYVPIIPALHAYVIEHREDPLVAAKLSWLLDEIEPFGGENGRGYYNSRHEAEEFHVWMPGFRHRHWPPLYDALLSILEGLHVDRPGQTPRALQKIRWKGSGSLLAYLLTELIEAEYLVPPNERPRARGGGSRAAVGKAVYEIFDIRGEDDQPVSLSHFVSLMRPNSPDRTPRSDLFRIRGQNTTDTPT